MVEAEKKTPLKKPEEDPKKSLPVQSSGGFQKPLGLNSTPAGQYRPNNMTQQNGYFGGNYMGMQGMQAPGFMGYQPEMYDYNAQNNFANMGVNNYMNNMMMYNCMQMGMQSPMMFNPVAMMANNPLINMMPVTQVNTIPVNPTSGATTTTTTQVTTPHNESSVNAAGGATPGHSSKSGRE